MHKLEDNARSDIIEKYIEAAPLYLKHITKHRLDRASQVIDERLKLDPEDAEQLTRLKEQIQELRLNESRE